MKKIKSYCLFFLVLMIVTCKKESMDITSDKSFPDTLKTALNNTVSSLCMYPYTVIVLDATMKDSSAKYLWSPDGDTTAHKIISAENYYSVIRTTSTFSDTLKVMVDLCDPVIWIPNSFSPNGDSLNDYWGPLANNIASIYFEIRNADGIILFKSFDLNNQWDGNINSKTPAPQGFYLYYIEYTDLVGKKITKTGTLELVR